MQSFSPINLEYDLVFIRHGETFGNCRQVNQKAAIKIEAVKANNKDYEKRLYHGCVDELIKQLLKSGKEQAENLANKLDNELIKNNWIPYSVLVSPLKRA